MDEAYEAPVRHRITNVAERLSGPAVGKSVKPKYRAEVFFNNYPDDRDAKREYDMGRLISYEWLTVWDSPQLKRSLWLLALSVVGLTTLSLTLCPNPVIEFGVCVTMSAGDLWFTFATLTAFMLSLFAANMFGRWWAVRDRLQTVQAAVMNAMYFLAGVNRLRGGVTASFRIARYFNLMNALAMKKFRGENLDEQLLKVTMPDGQALMYSDELDYLKTVTEPYKVVGTWIVQMCAPGVLLAESPGQGKYYMFMECSVRYLSEVIETVAVYIDEQLPRQYVQLLVLMTRVHITFVHLYSAALLGSGLQREDGVIAVNWQSLVQGYAIMIINFILYHGILQLTAMLSDPFGDDAVDMPIQYMWQRTCASSYDALNFNLSHFLPINPTGGMPIGGPAQNFSDRSFRQQLTL